jgi:hypothetical protein
MVRASAAQPLNEMVEKDLQRQVVDLASLLGYRRAYHTYDSRRSQTGFPDLVLVRDRVIFLELKREKTKTTPAQRDWLKALRDAGAEVYVVRPRNLDALAAVLGSRRRATSFLTTASAQEAQAELHQEFEKEIAA